MSLKPFDHFRPQSLGELKEILATGGLENFLLTGGGTDVLTRMRQGLISPRTVISLRGLPELKKLEQKGDNVYIGAGLGLHRLEKSPLIADNFPALARAAGYVGSPQLRNMGTIGGNIRLDTRCFYLNQYQWPGTFSPCYKRGGDICHIVKKGKRCHALFTADTPAALLAYDARISIAGPQGKRELPLDDFYRDDGLDCCLITEKEVILDVKLPLRPHRKSCYVRFSARGSLDFPLAGVAMALERDAGKNSFRIAATGISSRPVRLKKMEEILAGGAWPGKLTEKEFLEGLSGIKLVRHQGVSPSYRRELVKVMIERALAGLGQQ